MIIFYRLSSGGYAKQKLESATKLACLNNFLKVWGFFGGNKEDHLILLKDNVTGELWNQILPTINRISIYGETTSQTIPITIIDTNHGSSGRSFRGAFSRAIEPHSKESDDTVIYFVEDDYLHLPNARTVLLEGLERADYVTLYTHPDKFIPASKGGNPKIGDDGAELSKVFRTQHSYFQLTNSTTMTFATKLGTLREDKHIISRHCQGMYPTDYQMFLDLADNAGRSLIQPIPTQATHVESAWLSPLIGTGFNSWEQVIEKE
jgi:hypothetical protein